MEKRCEAVSMRSHTHERAEEYIRQEGTDAADGVQFSGIEARHKDFVRVCKEPGVGVVGTQCRKLLNKQRGPALTSTRK